MTWGKEEIRHLRLRMGWSQSDLARRLSCEPKIIESIEKGQFECPTSLRNELHMIERQAEECSDELQIQCVLESKFETEKVDQVLIDDISNG